MWTETKVELKDIVFEMGLKGIIVVDMVKVTRHAVVVVGCESPFICTLRESSKGISETYIFHP